MNRYMKTRLIKDNAGETLTAEGHLWEMDIQNALRPLVDKALCENVSLRDLTTMVFEEISALSSEKRIRLIIEERKNASKKTP